MKQNTIQISRVENKKIKKDIVNDGLLQIKSSLEDLKKGRISKDLKTP